MTKAANYTDAMVNQAVTMYQELGNDGMQQIADTLGRSIRSVRSKLVREGVYVAAEKPVKAAKVDGPSKKEMLNHLESLVPFPVDGLTGATKEALAYLIDYVESQAEPADEQPQDEDEQPESAAA
jgi:hypothetical protein